jgi:hypothetical protein
LLYLLIILAILILIHSRFFKKNKNKNILWEALSLKSKILVLKMSINVFVLKLLKV